LRNEKYKPQFFPFSAGIPWKVERGKYIVPEIDSETWHKVLDGRDIVITAFGGLFESFFSLAAAEALVSFDPGHKLFWLGRPEYSFLVRAQNVCKFCDINLTPDRLKSYPVPIFFDQEENAYFNLLNNYLIRTSYWGKYPEPVNAPVAQQIFNNVMVSWRRYIPQLRNLGTEFYDELCRTGQLRERSRIVLIVLNHTNDDTLQWNLHNIKEFSQLAAHKGLKVVVFTHNTRLFYGTKILAHEYDVRKVLQVMKHSWLVMSSDIDWLLIALMVSDAKVIARHIQGPFDLFKNAEFLEVHNDIFTDWHWVSPVDAFTICEGLL
jgi:hypothetical protein